MDSLARRIGRSRLLAAALAVAATGGAACGEGGDDRPASPAPQAPSPAPDAPAPGDPRAAGHAGDPSTWPTYGGDVGQTRYSPLDQVHAGNVDRLEPAWRYRTGVPGVLETTPLVVEGTLYLTTPLGEDGAQRVVALDAASGERRWETRLPVRRPQTHPTAANRGVAHADGRLFLATLDSRLVALDARTGVAEWESRTGDPAAGYGHKQAPLAHGGRIYLGVSGSPFGIRGFVKAFDAESGAELWTWHSIPSPEEGGWWGEWLERAPGTGLELGRDIARERADSARLADAWRRGGGAVWMTPTLDPALGLLFVSVGNPAPELVGSARPGDNRWTVGVCAIRTADGATEWCRQYIPHDVWGLDASSPPVLFGMEREGRRADAVGHFSKLGVFFAWERRTGEALTVSEPYVPHRNALRPPTREGVLMAPGIYGGTTWSPAAFHPGTGWLYAANIHWPGRYVVRGPGRVGFDLSPAAEAWGNVVAVDPVTGRVAWEARTPRPMVGGVLVTGGDLAFAGRLDGAFDAWHARTGERLWSHPVEFGCASAPITYLLEERQYVAVSCGGHFLGGPGRGDLVLAFALPEGAGGGQP